jgi:hypothetical protein
MWLMNSTLILLMKSRLVASGGTLTVRVGGARVQPLLVGVMVR